MREIILITALIITICFSIFDNDEDIIFKVHNPIIRNETDGTAKNGKSETDISSTQLNSNIVITFEDLGPIVESKNPGAGNNTFNIIMSALISSYKN